MLHCKTHEYLVSNHDDHVRIRKLVIHSFSDAALRSQEGLVVQYIELLMSKLKESISDPKKDGINDMTHWYSFLTFDIMADLCFAENFNALESGSYHPWMEAILEGASWGGTIRFLRAYPSLLFLAKAAKYLSSGTAEINTARKKHMQFSIEKTEKRLNMQLDRADIVNPVRWKHHG